MDRLRLLDTRTGQVRAVEGLPPGVIGDVHFAPWGTVGFSLTSARSPSDVYALDPATLAVTRWTTSETGGRDAGPTVDPAR